MSEQKFIPPEEPQPPEQENAAAPPTVPGMWDEPEGNGDIIQPQEADPGWDDEPEVETTPEADTTGDIVIPQEGEGPAGEPDATADEAEADRFFDKVLTDINRTPPFDLPDWTKGDSFLANWPIAPNFPFLAGDEDLDIISTPDGSAISHVGGDQDFPAQLLEDATAQVRFGKPLAVFTEGTTITLEPCDVSGLAIEGDNVAPYLLPSKASYTFHNATYLATTDIVHYTKSSGNTAYVLGKPNLILVDFRVNSGGTFQVKTIDTFGAWSGNTSDWTAKTGGTTVTVQADTQLDGLNFQKRFRDVVVLSDGTLTGWTTWATGDTCGA